jgi:hypothetical protein
VVRPLLRYSQLRRAEPVDAPSNDDSLARGRYFQADCLAGDVVGAFVYITGASIATIPQVTTVDIKVSGKYPAVGMILEKSTSTRCLVIVFGEVVVSPATLTPGKHYWIGTSGLLSATLPAPGVGERVATQLAGYAIDAGRLLISPERRVTIRVY